MTNDEFQDVMTQNNYLNGVIVGDQWYALEQLLFTTALIGGNLSTLSVGYEDRWCYHSLKDARFYMNSWIQAGAVGEPEGWHRHPLSGRRRTDGNPDNETIRH